MAIYVQERFIKGNDEDKMFLSHSQCWHLPASAQREFERNLKAKPASGSALRPLPWPGQPKQIIGPTLID